MHPTNVKKTSTNHSGLALQLVLTKVMARAISMCVFSLPVIKVRQITNNKIKSGQADNMHCLYDINLRMLAYFLK